MGITVKFGIVMEIRFGVVGMRNHGRSYIYTTYITYEELGYSMHHLCFFVDIWNRRVFIYAAMTAFGRLLDLK